MPRISMMLPFPPSCFASQSAPSWPYATWSLLTTYAVGSDSALSTATTTMPLSVACLITSLSASRSDGLMTITFAPDEIRLRMSAICPAASVVLLATITLETTPDALAWALIEQIISSRQPLPVSVLDTPTTYLVAVPPPLDVPPHATRANAATINAATNRPAVRGRSRCVTDDHLLIECGPNGPGPLPCLPRCSSVHLLSSSEAVGRAPRVLPVSRLEQLIGTPASHLGDARDHRRQLASREQELGGSHLDRIGDRDRRQCRAGPDRGLGQTVEPAERVSDRSAEVDHDIRFVHQAGAGLWLYLARLRLRDRCDRDHREAPFPGAPRELHDHRAQAARREHHHRVLRREVEVRQDDLGQAGHALDEHRLALAVGPDDLGVEGHRQLDDGVEARIGAIARKHLLHRDARVAGSEKVDETTRADRLRADLARPLDGVALRFADLFQDGDSRLDPAFRHGQRPWNLCRPTPSARSSSTCKPHRLPSSRCNRRRSPHAAAPL